MTDEGPLKRASTEHFLALSDMSWQRLGWLGWLGWLWA
jgi:hypothetical protein